MADHRATATAAFKEGNYHNAAHFYGKALELVDAADKPTIHSNLAACMLMLEKYPEALAQVEAALALDPAHPRALQRRRTALLRLGRFDDAALADDADAARARAALESGSDLDWLLETAPGLPAVWVAKARALIAARTHAAAVKFVRQAMVTHPETIGDLTEAYAEALTHTDPAAAAKETAAALHRDPDNGTMVRRLKALKTAERCKAAGNDSFKSGDLDSALAAYGEGIEACEIAVLFSNRAAVHLRAGRPQEALDDATRAATLSDDFAKAHARRGAALVELKDYPMAVDALRRAAELDPAYSAQLLEARKLNGEKVGPPIAGSGTIVEISSDAEYRLATSAECPATVIDFHAVWCGPCKAVAKPFKALAERFPGVAFVKVDIDKFGAIASELSISSVPTFLVLRQGALVERIQGADLPGLERALAGL